MRKYNLLSITILLFLGVVTAITWVVAFAVAARLDRPKATPLPWIVGGLGGYAFLSTPLGTVFPSLYSERFPLLLGYWGSMLSIFSSRNRFKARMGIGNKAASSPLLRERSGGWRGHRAADGFARVR